VGTAAIIMPWNEPLRVAEKVALLDQVANGRFRLGLGRGLSRREYGHFRAIEMDESRDRFDDFLFDLLCDGLAVDQACSHARACTTGQYRAR